MALGKKLQDRVEHHTRQALKLMDEADASYASGTGRYSVQVTVDLAQAHISMLLLLKDVER